jgi:hypothetical protein
MSMRVCLRFPRGVTPEHEHDPIVELAAVPRTGEAVETIAGTYLVRQVVWFPFEIQLSNGYDVCIELGRP